ncbi:MAG: mannose-1-phosphate guanylyltransferase [Saprospiraceae bacterium]|nr:mannose-1-phosphate guanylyltransferase [Saprospiraceae bacterium]
MNPNHYVAIMAGGVGSRFWPASREAKPKQFLDILGIGKSLLQMTYDRFLPLIPKENIFVVTNEMYADLVKEQLPDITNNQILSEPSRNNTAPCLAYTAFKLKNLNPNAVFVVASSDHFILNEGAFLDNISMALAFAESNDALLTLAIKPTSPNTGYGYVQFNRNDANNDGIFKVKSFTEKPNLDTACQFLAADNYLWNAGIFIWSVKSLLKAYKKHATEIFDILEQGNEVYNTAGEQKFVNEFYPKTPNISVDFAIMEKANNVYTIPGTFTWSDLGAWNALYGESTKDDAGNVLLGEQILASDLTNCLVRVDNPEKLVVLRGLDDFIVVDDGNALLIYPKAKEQEIKQVTELLKKTGKKLYL